jgi:DNA-binding Xre family transcriptional regulator
VSEDLTLKKKMRLMPKHLDYALTNAEPIARSTLDELCKMLLRH